jgi:hypothetical protein
MAQDFLFSTHSKLGLQYTKTPLDVLPCRVLHFCKMLHNFILRLMYYLDELIPLRVDTIYYEIVMRKYICNLIDLKTLNSTQQISDYGLLVKHITIIVSSWKLE